MIGLETLFDSDIGFGMLDGLVYGADDSDASVLVTTEGLADAWLVGHRDWWDSPTIPDNIRDALKVNAFYTQAISADAAVARFAEMPVTPPAGADFAYAILDMRSQDYAIGVPDEMIVAVVGGGRVFLANAPVTAPVHAIPACDTIWQDYSARGEAALQQSDGEDDGQSDDFDQIYAEGEAAFQDCFAEQAKGPGFLPRARCRGAGARRQAALINALASGPEAPWPRRAKAGSFRPYRHRRRQASGGARSSRRGGDRSGSRRRRGAG